MSLVVQVCSDSVKTLEGLVSFHGFGLVGLGLVTLVGLVLWVRSCGFDLVGLVLWV